MKVGIFTFHRALNIGASLQAFALQEYINENICDAELVDYYPNNSIPRRKTILRKAAHLVRWLTNYDLMKNDKKKRDSFGKFWNSYYRVSEKSYFGDNDVGLKKLDYDVLISGSDQILNCTLTGNSNAYYLSFAEKAKRISYASSFGREEISSQEHELIEKELVKFSAISVREESASTIIKEDIGINPNIVVDPVFLLEREKWEKIAIPQNIGKYILVYAMESTPQIIKAIEFASTFLKLPTLIICGGKSAENLTGKKIVVCGPERFLGLLMNAEFVVTNSFHGTALSFIFGKKTIVTAHSSRNTRLDNIMRIINQSSKLVFKESDVNENNIIDGEEAYKEMAAVINNSKLFLKQSI